MKKTLLFVTVAVLVFTTAFASFAAVPSIEPEKAPNVEGVTAGDGTVLDSSVVIVTPLADADTLAEDEKEALISIEEDIKASEDVEDFLEKIGMSSAISEIIPLDEAAVHSLFDLYMNDTAREALEKTGSLTILFNAEDIEEGDKVAVLLYNKNTGEWGLLPSFAGNGFISSVLRYAASSNYCVMILSGRHGGTISSPDTSDFDYTAVYSVLVISVVLLASMALSRKRI